MARKAFLTAALPFLLGLSSFAQTFAAEVIGVADGDTITVYDGTERTRIRLEGIDYPEGGPTSRGEPSS